MEHYTRNTESVTAWCPRCQRMTEHRVDHSPTGGRLGPCLEHRIPIKKKNPKKPEPPKSGDLFEGK